MPAYIHSKKTLFKETIQYIFSLLPLYLYGFYKNGLLLYSHHLVSFWLIPKIFYLLFLSLISYFLLHIIFKKKIQINLLLSNFIICLFVPYSFNLILYFLLISLFNFLNIYFTPKIDLTNPIIFIIITSLFVSFLNPHEALNNSSFSSLDLLMGRNVAGIGNSSIILSFLILLYLHSLNIYKASIAVTSSCVYLFLSLLFQSTIFLFNANVWSSFIFLSTWSSQTPLTQKYQIIYGIICGSLSFICTKYINFYYGTFVAIIFCQILFIFICKVSKKML